MRHVKILVTAIVILGVAALGAGAFARTGKHYGPNGMGHGAGAGNLTSEEWRSFQDERTAFMTETHALRQNLRQKNLELRSELAKSKPDSAKAAGIQKEIASIRANLDQRHLNHNLRLNKIRPGLGASGRGFGGGRMGAAPRCRPAE